MKTIVHVVGARPNYMKIAPLMRALRDVPTIRQVLVNTGQHYDKAMSTGFFSELEIPSADRDLGVGSASHATQTARVMIGFEAFCLEDRPDLVVVVGDVNSTMAAALVAAKLLIPVAHVEAGLRSFDRTMPEEINRLVTDRLSDVLLTPSADANDNLIGEGVAESKIHLVGNIMIDTLMRYVPLATISRLADRVQVSNRNYAVLTLHRPSNVDDVETLRGILSAVTTIAASLPVVFPVHPRTRERLRTLGMAMPNIQLTEPMGYIDFLSLTSHARVVLTDSGGLQEESTALGIPCLTLRDSTERPATVNEGTNRVVGSRPEAIIDAFQKALSLPNDSARRPPLWDGHTAERVVTVLKDYLFAA